MHRNRILISSLILLDILFVTLIVSLFTKLDKETVATALSFSPQTEVAGLETEGNLEGIHICGEYFCKNIDSHVVRSWFNEGKLDKTKMYVYLADKVYPELERRSGGMTTVENRHGEFEIWVQDERLNYEDLHLRMEDILNDYDHGLISATINLDTEELPGTDGTYADKYMEVDNSRQVLYVWEEGEVIKEIKLSGPRYGYQVYGVYPIIDKGIAPIAPGGKYMPYWMAFYHSPSQDSWYGLHALIWWYGDNGERVYESLDNIGERKSAGCIRMLLEDSKYLYERFERGDMLLIHE